MERLGIRFFLISLACVICAPAVFAQNGKLIKGVAKGLGRTSAAEGIVKAGARNLPGAAAYSVPSTRARATPSRGRIIS